MSTHAHAHPTMSLKTSPENDVSHIVTRTFRALTGVSFDMGTSAASTRIEDITWPVAASVIAVLSTILLFAYSKRSHTSPAASSISTTTRVPFKQRKSMAAKPKDGTVHVSGIFVHPLKSCRGVSVKSAKYDPEGLEHDRKWCIMDATTNTIITAREFPKMVLITPEIEVDTASPHGGLLKVVFPKESECPSFHVPLQPTKEILDTWTMLPEITLWVTHDAVDGYICQTLPSEASSPSPSEILSTYFGKPVHLIYKGPRARAIDATAEFPDLKATAMYQDMYPLMVLSAESLGSVEENLKEHIGKQGITEEWRDAKIPMQRFRPNIVFSGGGPFAEDNWEEIEIGSGPRITLVSKCVRCLLPNVSPETGERDQAVPYKVLMKFRTGLDPVKQLKPCVGCNGVPDEVGVVNVGDIVKVRKMIGE